LQSARSGDFGQHGARHRLARRVRMRSRPRKEGCSSAAVFAHGYTVGQAPGQSYRYWEDRWNKDAGAGRDGFWYPPSPLPAIRSARACSPTRASSARS
jgi:hypothetical protein